MSKTEAEFDAGQVAYPRLSADPFRFMAAFAGGSCACLRLGRPVIAREEMSMARRDSSVVVVFLVLCCNPTDYLGARPRFLAVFHTVALLTTSYRDFGTILLRGFLFFFYLFGIVHPFYV